MRLLHDKSLFLFDLDGVFYKGKEVRVKIGGTQAVAALRAHRKKLFVLTNNSTDSVETIHARLVAFGIRVKRSEVLTSGLLTAEYVLKDRGPSKYFMVGEGGLQREMTRCGHKRVLHGRADVVVVGLDRRLTYAKLDEASRLVRGGAALVATHAASLYMSNRGPAMATGPLVRAIEYASGRRATVVGKPSPLMFKAALSRAACRPGDAVMVGDQVETDLLGAKRAGIDSILVTTGVDNDDEGTGTLATLSNVDDLVTLI